MKSRNCSTIKDKPRRHFSKFSVSAFSNFRYLSKCFGQIYGVTSVVHQYGGLKIVLTSETYFGYLVDLLSDLNQQPLIHALFLILLTPKMAIYCVYFSTSEIVALYHAPPKVVNRNKFRSSYA